MQFTVRRISFDENPQAICAQMQPDTWGKDNEMTAYEPALLRSFLEAGNYLVLAYEGDRIAGAATAYPLPHPSAGGSSLYVHEVDTHPDFRQRGVATKLMGELFAIAKEQGLSEVWLGADDGNEPAHALYKGLHPYEADHCTIYAYKTND